VKCTRSQSIEAGSSKKTTRRESVAEIPSEGISILVVNLVLIHASSEEDEGSEILLHPRRCRIKGLIVVIIEALLEEVTGRQATGGDFVLAPVPTKTAPSGSFQSQGKNVDPTNFQPGSQVEKLSLAGVSEQSPTTGLVGAKLPTTRVLPTPVSSLSSSKKLDYSGDNDVDWNNVHHALDTSKYSHLAEEEMQVVIPET